jgi:hypothetical protein
MTETPNLPNPEQDPKPYRLYEDAALLGAAEGDDHLGLYMKGLQMATKFVEDNPDDLNLQAVALAAEAGLRAWIERQGYVTLEPKEEDRPEQP